MILLFALSTLLLGPAPPPPPPTTNDCIGVDDCRRAEALENKAAGDAQRRQAELEAARQKMDSCKGLKACEKAQAEYKQVEDAQRGTGPSPAAVVQARADYMEDRQSASQQARTHNKALARKQKTGTLTLGGGYVFFWMPDDLPFLHGGGWSLNGYKNWYLPHRNVQLSLGSGIRGLHTRTTELYDEFYGTTVDFNIHYIVVPVEFRFGGPWPDHTYVYGMIGGALGLVAGKDSEGGQAMGLAIQAVLLGFGGYGTLGASNTIMGAEIRTDPVNILLGGGGPLVDIQFKIGKIF